jgi:hypothetical protein
MLAFIYLAYSMMALLYETVPALEDTWIECLSDLGRYRMAIEDDNIRDREVWTGVARHWYSSLWQGSNHWEIISPLSNRHQTQRTSTTLLLRKMSLCRRTVHSTSGKHFDSIWASIKRTRGLRASVMIEANCIELGNKPPALHRDFHFPASNCVQVEFGGTWLHVLRVNVLQNHI